MEVGDWDSISREVISLFTALADQTPVYMLCLDWEMVSSEFEDESGWTRWSNDGNSLKSIFDSSSATFLIFSELGIHEMIYRPDKAPELKHIIKLTELDKFKVIKSRHDKLEIRIQREKDFIVGKMNFIDSYKLNFNSDKWDFIKLRRHILVGKKEAIELIKRSEPKTKIPKSKTRSKVSTSPHTRAKLRSKLDVQIKQPHETVVDDYQESINNAKLDISALKKPSNRKIANNALDRMREAADIIKQCDTDVNKRNHRIRKLKHELVEIRKKPMRKLEKKTRMNELERKIKMIDKMNEKELMIKTQNVQEFCSLREAVLTIRTNEEHLKTKEIQLLIEDAGLNETLAETKKKLQHKPITGEKIKKSKMKLLELPKLVEEGNKEQWMYYMTFNLKQKNAMKLPVLDQSKCRFKDYGYRQLIELIIESPEFLRVITEIKDVAGYNIVELNKLIRGDSSTVRGLEALCSLMVNRVVKYNPVSETDFKYLNLLLNSISIPKKDGINRLWKIKTENAQVKITAEFDKGSMLWVYSLE